MTKTATTQEVITKYDEIVRGNMSADWDTIKAVAECEDGMYGALGELFEVAEDLGYPLEDDADRDALQDAFEDEYQPRLRAEVAAR